MARWFISSDSGRRRAGPAVALFAALLSGACTIGPTTPDPTPPTAVAPFTATRKAPDSTQPPVVLGLSAGFAELEKTLGGSVGLAIAPIGGSQAQLFGSWEADVAWSTIKVPLAIAYVRESGTVSDDVRVAITESDNAASERVWAKLGEPKTASVKVVAVLRDGGDDETLVQDVQVRPPYTPFGQSIWSLRNQALFTANLPCIARGPEVLTLMGETGEGQRWGLATIPGARYKGGWGPDEQGKYLVRQFGVIAVPGGGEIAVAMAATPDSGTYEDGVQILDKVGVWIKEHIADLTGGAC
jgi:hypothetical protein